MNSTAPLIKFDVCIYKKDELSEEEFLHWATKTYPLKATALIKKHGIVKWTQVCYISITCSQHGFSDTSCQNLLDYIVFRASLTCVHFQFIAILTGRNLT
jgi:hypothetical protein